MRDKLEKHIQAGLKLFEERDYEGAYSELSQAIYQIEEEEGDMYMNPSQISEIFMFRASAMMAMDNHAAYNEEETFQEALQDYESAIDYDPKNPLLYNLRGKTYMRATYQDFLEEAKEDFNKALEINPKDASAMKSLGEVLSKQGQFDQAIRLLSQVLEEGKDAESFMLRGVANFKKPRADFAAAAADFERAIEILPQLDELYIWRAQSFQNLGDRQSAVKEYNRLIDRVPNISDYYVDRGSLLHNMDPEAAMKDYSYAIKLDQHPLAYNNRASLYVKKRLFDLAIQDAEKALNHPQSPTVAYATMAEIYANMNESDQMYKFLELALQHYYEDILDVYDNEAFKPYHQEEEFQKLVSKKKW
ncbi:MAG: tetratricopeptide repeat protein [Bacteroidota bacterium]